MATKPAMLWFCIFIFWCLPAVMPSVNSKPAKEATVNVTLHLWFKCDISLEGITTKDEKCYDTSVHIVQDADHVRPSSRSFVIASASKDNPSGSNEKAKWSYRKGQFEVHYSPGARDPRGFYKCLYSCISSKTLEYEMNDVKTLIIGRPISGILYSFPDGFECNITQMLDLNCSTGCGCNTSMKVSPPGSCPVGQGDGDHGKQSQPSWHCEGDKPRSAAQPPAICYLKFWCSKFNCTVKHRCTGRDNTPSIFDCYWDQGDGPGECELQNNVPVSGTVTDNSQEQSDSAKSQGNNFNHKVAENTTPAVDHHNDNITDDVNSQEHNLCIITVIAVTGIVILLVCIYVFRQDIWTKLVSTFKARTRFIRRSQSSSVIDPAANPSSSVQVGAEDNGSIAGHEDGADEEWLRLAGRGIVPEIANFCGNAPGSVEKKAYQLGTKFRGGKKRKP